MDATIKRAKRKMTSRARGAMNSHSMSELRAQAATVGDDVRELAATAGQAAWAQTEPIEDYVREKPIKSVLIAAGVGALLGVLFFRR